MAHVDQSPAVTQKYGIQAMPTMIAFRKECRAYAEHWLSVQREEFKRLGVEGDWNHPYTTMSFEAEATIGGATVISCEAHARIASAKGFKSI